VVEEKQESVQENWAAMKDQAYQRDLKPTEAEFPAPKTSKKVSTTAAARRRSNWERDHPQLGWVRENGIADCCFCGKKCVKYSYPVLSVILQRVGLVRRDIVSFDFRRPILRKKIFWYCGGIEWMCRRSARSSGQ
jgi:hypothetical protein